MNAIRLFSASTLGRESTSALPSRTSTLICALSPWKTPEVARLSASSALGYFSVPKVSVLVLSVNPLPVGLPERAHFTPISSSAVEEISRIIASMMICLADLSTSRFNKSSNRLNCSGSFSL